jgi:hypothetical protein
MGLNTNVLILKNVPEHNYYSFAKEFLLSLDFQITNEFGILNDLDKSNLLYQNQNTIAITYLKGDLYFEDYLNKFVWYSRNCLLQQYGYKQEVFHVEICSTVDILC